MTKDQVVKRDLPSNVPRTIWLRPGVPLMIRWTVFGLFGYRICLAAFLNSDPDDLHDHPWNFMTILLAGSYTEVTPGGAKQYRAPAILFRRAIDRHRIEITAPVLTLVVTAPRRRGWGFYTSRGFMPWWVYLRPPRRRDV